MANPRNFSLSKREADLAVGMAPPPDGRVYARKLVDYELALYASRAYCESHPPIRSRADLEQHRWVGYVEDLMWTQELNYLPQVSGNIAPPLHISNVISQMSAIAGTLKLPDVGSPPYPAVVQGPGWLGLRDGKNYVPYHEGLLAAGIA